MLFTRLALCLAFVAIQVVAQQSFSLSAEGEGVAVAADSSAHLNVKVSAAPGYSHPIYLMPGGLPEGIGLALPSPVVAGQTVDIKVSAAASAKVQKYVVTVYAAGGGENHSLTFGITVLPLGTAPPESSFPASAVLTGLDVPSQTTLLPANQDIGAHWVGAWGASAVTPSNDSGAYYLTNVTVRQIAHLSIGTQTAMRIKLSNALGKEPVIFGAVHVAQWAGSAENISSAIDPETDRAVTFSKAGSVTVPAGAEVWSDPIRLPVKAQTDIAVTFFIPRTSNVPATMHTFGNQTAFFALGDCTASTTMPKAVTDTVRPYLTAIDVDAPGASAIVALGDSLTDGMGSSKDKNVRWTDDLARRLQEAAPDRMAVVNSGISGNCVVTACWGPAIPERLQRDVLNVSGVKYLVVLAGLNDIGHAPDLTADQLTGAYRAIVDSAHAQGVQVFGGTIPPFAGSAYFSADHEKIRQAVNQFIRQGGVFDGVVDFDTALADKANPAFLRADFNGDKIRPNDAGYQAMADAVDLARLQP